MINLLYWHLRRLRLRLQTGFADLSLFLAVMPPPLPQHHRAGRISENIQKRSKWARSLEVTVLNVKNSKRRELMSAKLRSWKGTRFGWRRCQKFNGWVQSQDHGCLSGTFMPQAGSSATRDHTSFLISPVKSGVQPELFTFLPSTGKVVIYNNHTVSNFQIGWKWETDS